MIISRTWRAKVRGWTPGTWAITERSEGYDCNGGTKVTTEVDLTKYPRDEGFDCNGGAKVTNEKDPVKAGPTKF